MFLMVQNVNPLENCDEKVKDIFYNKKNRKLLDFLQKCWRPQCAMRPTAAELIQHPFLKKKKKLQVATPVRKEWRYDPEVEFKKRIKCEKCKRKMDHKH